LEHRHGDREGAKQPERFDPARAARLDDPERLIYLPPARIADLLALGEGTALDFGAGTGAYALPLARLLPKMTILALDEQPEMLAMLQSKLAADPLPNVRPIAPDALNSLTGRIDRVLAINVLHEIGDRDLDAIPALLTTAGEAVFIDWDAEADRPVGPPAEHVYGAREAATRLERHGFQALRTVAFPYHYAIVCRPMPADPPVV
jgi:cyclopropane fatty-acyl-phospholipid synthase-like methyltransferase